MTAIEASGYAIEEVNKFFQLATASTRKETLEVFLEAFADILMAWDEELEELSDDEDFEEL